MIAFLRGNVFRVGAGYVELDVKGVGYRVWVSERFASRSIPGEESFVYVHHHVREDAVQLFGFEHDEERDWFELLIGVSGIGPKSAMQLVSASEPNRFYEAVSMEDLDYLCTLPTIGKKTAQRLIVELKDQIKSRWVPTTTASPGKRARSPVIRENSLLADLVEALTALGYQERHVFPVAEAYVDEERPSSLEEALRGCLRQLDRLGTTR